MEDAEADAAEADVRDGSDDVPHNSIEFDGMETMSALPTVASVPAGHSSKAADAEALKRFDLLACSFRNVPELYKLALISAHTKLEETRRTLTTMRDDITRLDGNVRKTQARQVKQLDGFKDSMAEMEKRMEEFEARMEENMTSRRSRHRSRSTALVEIMGDQSRRSLASRGSSKASVSRPPPEVRVLKRGSTTTGVSPQPSPRDLKRMSLTMDNASSGSTARGPPTPSTNRSAVTESRTMKDFARTPTSSSGMPDDVDTSVSPRKESMRVTESNLRARRMSATFADEVTTVDDAGATRSNRTARSRSLASVNSVTFDSRASSDGEGESDEDGESVDSVVMMVSDLGLRISERLDVDEAQLHAAAEAAEQSKAEAAKAMKAAQALHQEVKNLKEQLTRQTTQERMQGIAWSWVKKMLPPWLHSLGALAEDSPEALAKALKGSDPIDEKQLLETAAEAFREQLEGQEAAVSDLLDRIVNLEKEVYEDTDDEFSRHSDPDEDSPGHERRADWDASADGQSRASSPEVDGGSGSAPSSPRVARLPGTLSSLAPPRLSPPASVASSAPPSAEPRSAAVGAGQLPSGTETERRQTLLTCEVQEEAQMLKRISETSFPSEECPPSRIVLREDSPDVPQQVETVKSPAPAMFDEAEYASHRKTELLATMRLAMNPRNRARGTTDSNRSYKRSRTGTSSSVQGDADGAPMSVWDVARSAMKRLSTSRSASGIMSPPNGGADSFRGSFSGSKKIVSKAVLGDALIAQTQALEEVGANYEVVEKALKTLESNDRVHDAEIAKLKGQMEQLRLGLQERLDGEMQKIADRMALSERRLAVGLDQLVEGKNEMELQVDMSRKEAAELSADLRSLADVACRGVDGVLKQVEEETGRFRQQASLIFARAMQEQETTAEMNVTEARLFGLDTRLDAIEKSIWEGAMHASRNGSRPPSPSPSAPDGSRSRSVSPAPASRAAPVGVFSPGGGAVGRSKWAMVASAVKLSTSAARLAASREMGGGTHSGTRYANGNMTIVGDDGEVRTTGSSPEPPEAPPRRASYFEAAKEAMYEALQLATESPSDTLRDRGQSGSSLDASPLRQLSDATGLPQLPQLPAGAGTFGRTSLLQVPVPPVPPAAANGMNPAGNHDDEAVQEAAALMPIVKTTVVDSGTPTEHAYDALMETPGLGFGHAVHRPPSARRRAPTDASVVSAVSSSPSEVFSGASPPWPLDGPRVKLPTHRLRDEESAARAAVGRAATPEMRTPSPEFGDSGRRPGAAGRPRTGRTPLAQLHQPSPSARTPRKRALAISGSAVPPSPGPAPRQRSPPKSAPPTLPPAQAQAKPRPDSKPPARSALPFVVT